MIYTLRLKTMQLIGTPVSQYILVVLSLLVLIGVTHAESRSATVVREGAEQETPGSADTQPIAEGGETLQIFLPLVASGHAQESLLVEQPPQKLTSSSSHQAHVGNSDVAPPEANNHTFVTDSGGTLDQYVRRADLPNGRLTFPIGINAPVLKLRPDQLNPDGTIAGVSFLALVDQHILPEYAQLTLQVYDVDDELILSCLQVDHVYINGHQIDDPKRLSPARLSGGNEVWNTWTIAFPAYKLKYPNSPGVNGALPVAVANEIAIEVDTAQCQNAEWRVEVDWGAISVRSAQNYPLFFVHGWKGTPQTFDDRETLDFGDFAEEAGIYTYTANIEHGILPMPYSVVLLKTEINKALTQFNTDRLNLFGHSRGGLFIRSALRKDSKLADHINAYVTFGTPHHGTDAPLKTTGWPLHYCNPPIPEDGDPPIPSDYEERCIQIAEQLTIAAMRSYNYGEQCRLIPSLLTFTIEWKWVDCIPQWSEAEHLVRSYTLVGGAGEIWGSSATFPWVAWDAGEYPYPEVRRVDGFFPIDTHLTIKSSRAAYDYAMDLITAPDTPTVQSAQIKPSNNVAPLHAASTATVPELTEQPMYAYAGDLAANSLITFAIPVEAITGIRLNVIASTTLSVTLVDPSALLVTPLTAEANPQITYTVTPMDDVNNSYVQYQYHIESPVDGLWQVQIEAVDAAAFVFYTTIQSPVALLATTDLGVYTPGQTVLVQTGLFDDITLQSGAVITGTLRLPDDSSLPVIFYDDGTHGDAGAGNEVYTAQLTAPAFNGRPRLLIQATKGNILRQTEVMFTVAAQTATFQQVTDEAVVDTNNNGYADELNLAVELNVLTAGDYIISGLLADSNGTTLASATYSTIDTETPLVTGIQTVHLSFIGNTLRTSGVDGPYQLKEVTVRYYDPAAYDTFTVDRETNVYTTTNYTANQFEGELVQVTGSSEGVKDVNTDGLYDSLKISVTLDLLLPGAYSWFGELVDANGVHVTGASGSGTLNSQTPAVFTFGGWQIYNTGINGPYRLTNVYVTKATGQVFTEYFDDVNTTAAYQASQFGVLPLVLTTPQQQTVDGNGNGLYDALVVTTTVTAMTHEGPYTWSGRLVAPNGTEVAVASGGGLLYDGKALTFVFLSPTIRSAGINGPYTVRDVTLTSSDLPTITALIPVFATTPAYPATQFDDWGTSVVVHNIAALDVDGNNLYDRLEFNTTIDLPWPGSYYLRFALTTQSGVVGPYSASRESYNGQRQKLLDFTGLEIVTAGLDGPYVLKLISFDYIHPGGNAISLGMTPDLFTTPAYLANQFQSVAPLPPPAEPIMSQPLNDDHDGTYTVEWSAVADATHYELQERYGALISNPYVTVYTGTVPSVVITGRGSGTYFYRVRAMLFLQASSWSSSTYAMVSPATPTPTPTPTLTPTPTPTLTPTQTPLPTFVTDAVIYLSSDSGGTVSGIAFADEDVLAYNTVTGLWSMAFDGSDVGATANVNAVHVESDGTWLLSFDTATTLAGLGAVEDEDIVRFLPTTLGDTTAGTFAWMLDGSDVGLDTADEDIDAITRAPDGSLVISSDGIFNAGGVSGNDKHLFVFTATSLGETTSGTWAIYFDGADVGLTGASEDIWGAEIVANGDIYLTTISTYAVPGVSGDSDDFFLCKPGSLGEVTTCSFYLYWDGDSYGVGSEWLDALAIVAPGSVAPTPTPGPTNTPTATPVAPTDTPTPAGPPTDTPTPGSTSSPTDTSLPTATPIPGDTPTPGSTSSPTPQPTATPTSSGSTVIYTSSESGGTVNGIAFADEDILTYDTVTGVWAMLFDGSDVGAGTDVNAVHVESDGTLLLSFDSTTTLAGLGAVEDEDIVRFIPTTLGDVTAGSFAWVLDGSDVELDTTDEDIDAIARAPDGRLVISSDGVFNAGGVSGVSQDLFVFTATSLGETTSGTWAIYVDGSDVGLTTSTENIWGAEIAANGDIYLTTISTYAVTGVSGDILSTAIDEKK